MTIKELLRGCDHRSVNVPPDLKVKGISVDSRNIKKGDLFVAIKGHEHDGHDFIPDAIKKGAACICSMYLPKGFGGDRFIIVRDTAGILSKLAGNFFGEPSKDLRFIGVTGTNGKTTTTHLVYEIFREAKRKPALLGTIKHKIRDDVVVSGHTTPAPLELHSYLRKIKRKGCEYVIMEVSSHALKQSRTAGIDYDVAAVTNVTGDHLDYHVTMSDYVRSKKMLFGSLRRDSAAVLNSDDPFYGEFRRSTKAKIVTYSIEKKSHFTARDIKMDISGSRFFLKAPKGTINIRTPLIGRHNIYNILAAAAVSYAAGIEPKVIRKVIGRFDHVSGRLESIDLGQRFKVFVDYAHTHDALQNILTELKRFNKGELVVVFGCGGNRDKSKRPKMGKIASELADRVIITNDNPRGEDPDQILDEIEKGFSRDFNSYERIPDRFKAIERSLEGRAASDIVVIAGKGHEDYQIIGDERFPFNDREAVGKIIDVHGKRDNKSD